MNRSRQQIDLSLAELTMRRLDRVVEVLLIALLTFMPLTFGAVEAWSEMVIVALSGGIAATLSLKFIFHRDTRIPWSWAFVPVGLFLLLITLQLLVLPTQAVETISPNTAAIKTQLMGDLPEASTILKSMTLSFYPLATRHDLRMVMVIIVVFVAVVMVYRQPRQIKRLLGAITLIGGAVALIALAQDLLGNGKIYWFVQTNDNASSGPFINHSHYGQFMNLSIGAALALLLVKLHENFQHGEVRLPSVIRRLGDHDLRWLWYLIAMIVIGVATIFVSLTRGGMITLLVAGSFTALLMTTKRGLKGRGWIMALMALAAFSCILYIGFESVYDRLATLQNEHCYDDRWDIIRDLSVSVTRFPLTGTGLGTHAYVYPMFDRSTIPSLAAHAENEYAQLAEETGVTGLVLAVIFGVIVWTCYARSIRSLRTPIRSAAFGLGFGLIAILLHSFSDFGQHIPANAGLSAVACALLICIAQIGGEQRDTSTPNKKPLSPIVAKMIGILGLLAVLAIWSWSLPLAHNARLAEAHWQKAQTLESTIRQNDWQAENEDYAELIAETRDASACEPDNILYRHWLNVYRWYSISRVTDPQTGEIVVTPQTLEFTARIVQELQQAIPLCPSYGATYCVAGQLEQFILNKPDGARYIRTGYSLSPCDAAVCYSTGLLDASESKFEESLEKFSRCLKLDGRYIQDIINLYIYQVKRPDLAVQIAKENVGWLFNVVAALRDDPDQQDLVAQARTQAVELLKTKSQEPGAPAWTLASMANIYFEQKEYDQSIDYYRRALVGDYGQVNWRLGLANALARNGQVPEAIHEARICLRLRPQMTSAQKLVADLSVQPGAVAEKKSRSQED